MSCFTCVQGKLIGTQGLTEGIFNKISNHWLG